MEKNINEDLEMGVKKYTIRRYEGLWRFYHDIRRIPVSSIKKYAINDKNLASGKVFIKQTGYGKEVIQKEYEKFRMLEFEMSWDEQSHWCYDDKTGRVYRWYIGDQPCTWKEKRYIRSVLPGTDPKQVLMMILDRDITVQDAPSEPVKHARWTKFHENRWSDKFDGKSILALVILKPKMTYAEIKNIIINEGGTVDSQGTIHKASK